MKKMVLMSVLLCLSGCATMSEKFSCNITAGDSCMTIDEVNAMTEEKDPYVKNRIKIRRPANVAQNDEATSTLWIAPFKDDKGHAFDEKTIVLNESEKGSV